MLARGVAYRQGTYDRGLEVVDDFDDGLPFLNLDLVGRGDRRGDDTLEGGQAREEGDGDSGESHLGRLIVWYVWVCDVVKCWNRVVEDEYLEVRFPTPYLYLLDSLSRRHDQPLGPDHHDAHDVLDACDDVIHEVSLSLWIDLRIDTELIERDDDLELHRHV